MPVLEVLGRAKDASETKRGRHRAALARHLALRNLMYPAQA